jgi:hypothetical protein
MREGQAATDKRQEIKVAQQGNPADPINSAADFHVMADFDFYFTGKWTVQKSCYNLPKF